MLLSSKHAAHHHVSHNHTRINTCPTPLTALPDCFSAHSVLSLFRPSQPTFPPPVYYVFLLPLPHPPTLVLPAICHVITTLTLVLPAICHRVLHFCAIQRLGDVETADAASKRSWCFIPLLCLPCACPQRRCTRNDVVHAYARGPKCRAPCF